MKYLHYTIYLSGRAGLSNNIMSFELGVALACLMERVLVVEGNVSPPANVVDYGGRVSNRHPSRVTDLLQIPVPWLDAAQIELRGLGGVELTEHCLMGSVFYFPPHLDTTSPDFRSFARDRSVYLTYTPELREEFVIRMSGGPPVGDRGFRMHNFGFYSYLFYLDAPTRRLVHEVLRRMTPVPSLAELAADIVKQLGEFNAVHVRRGDFKYTTGVTTRDRTAAHALETMDRNFGRDERLVILTDEREDPFFDEIVACYPDSVFLDEFVLDAFGDAFRDLPAHDSIALAFLSQLVASHARDFIGSMTSTFTSLIQRYRGNRGLPERFKFLWNELPDEGVELRPGSHPLSDCVPLEAGVMVEQYEGPYSWNRYNPRLNPAWMREWPEAFLRPEVPRPCGS